MQDLNFKVLTWWMRKTYPLFDVVVTYRMDDSTLVTQRGADARNATFGMARAHVEMLEILLDSHRARFEAHAIVHAAERGEEIE